MKKLLSLVSALSLAVAAQAGLQVPSMTYNNTNAVTGSTATNYAGAGIVFTMTQTSDPTVQVAWTSAAANTANVTWVFDASVDNSTWVTNAMALTSASVGLGTASVLTNLPAGMRYPFWRLEYVTNAAASVQITNLTLKVWTKDGF